MFQVFEAENADAVWQKAASALRLQLAGSAQPSRAGLTHELLHAALCIRDPRQRWVVSRYPAISPVFALAEVVWIVTGRNDSGFLNFFNRQLPDYCGPGETYHGAYGFRLRRHFGVDQLTRAYESLQGQADSRQIVLNLWDPGVDLPGSTGLPAARDIPCNILALLKLRGGKLEWTQVLRSNDIYLGLPYNLVQFTTLQEVIAGWLGVELGSYHQLSDSLHVYLENVDSLAPRARVGAEPNTDSLAFPKAQSESYFAEVSAMVDEIISGRLSSQDLVVLTRRTSLPQPFLNMLLLLSAGAARRYGWTGLDAELLEGCTNKAFKQLYQRWVQRPRLASKAPPALVPSRAAP